MHSSCTSGVDNFCVESCLFNQAIPRRYSYLMYVSFLPLVLLCSAKVLANGSLALKSKSKVCIAVPAEQGQLS